MSGPRVAVLPPFEPIVDAVVEAGGSLVAPEEADAIVWTDPRDPGGLGQVLAGSPARWVQLPFAGIESFFDAGVIDPGRTWTCAKGIYGPACAEHAVALMLTASRLLHRHARARRWWSGVEAARMRRVQGATAVVVGTGGIGRAFAEMAAPLGVRVIGVNRSGAAMEGAVVTVAVDALADALPQADYVVVAAAHTPQTHRMFDAAALAHMAGHAWLINVARGGLIDTDALVEALRTGTIGGAALDVTDPEPLPEGHPLWEMDNVVITSHTANTREMAIPELRAMVADNVRRFAQGARLDGLVDPAAGY